MIAELQDKVAKYITKNASASDWKSIREYYARYSYMTFMCLIANNINPNCETERVGSLLYENFLENKEIVQYILTTEDAINFMREIISLIRKQNIQDINKIYQQFLASDFILKDNTVSFDRSKNNRDILGSYYTQEDFAYEITKKSIADYYKENNSTDIKIADYSCGGGAFLVSACKVCREKEIVPMIYGYDVDPIAVLITRFRLFTEAKLQAGNCYISLGNPLLRNTEHADVLSIFKCAISGRFYNIRMGIVSKQNIDVIIGNPPWEKIRFEEKKFLHHFAQGTDVGTKTERESFLQKSSCGELNTYALFTELCLNSLGKTGVS